MPNPSSVRTRIAGVLERARGELRAEASPEEVDHTLRRLALRTREAAVGQGVVASVAMVGEGRPGAQPILEALMGVCAERVTLEPGVYTAVPTASARVALLEAAGRAARRHVILHVAIDESSTYRGRALIDGPRRLARALGLRAAEPGDRFGPEAFVHAFFDEEPLVREAERAGLVVVQREGFAFTLERARPEHVGEPGQAEAFARELARVLLAAPYVERARRTIPPEPCIQQMRARGERTSARERIGRARLRRAIGWVDACTPGGGNCLRRLLLEVALDRGAARRTIVFGLDVGKTGHVAFEGDEERTFDVAFALSPDKSA